MGSRKTRNFATQKEWIQNHLGRKRLGCSNAIMNQSTLKSALVIGCLIPSICHADAERIPGSIHPVEQAVTEHPSNRMLQAAEQGDPIAQFQLAEAYQNGWNGIPKSLPVAIEWYEKAANQGHAASQMRLGNIHLNGKEVPKNATEAAKWFRKSAAQNNPDAQCQMARMHLAGSGVIKDPVEAYQWAGLAASQGNAAARRILIHLENHLTPNELAKARHRLLEPTATSSDRMPE